MPKRMSAFSVLKPSRPKYTFDHMPLLRQETNSMQLKKAKVLNFRCIDDSTEFSLNRVTCLVGKNESGKTSVLTAIYRLNPYADEDKHFDKEADFPRRRLTDYDETYPDGDALVVESFWELEPEELAIAQKLVGVDSFAKPEFIRITRSYEEDQKNRWEVKVDEAKTLKYIIKNSTLHEEEKTALTALKSIAELKTHLAALTEPSERHDALTEHLKKSFKRGTATTAIIDALHERMPKFVYFSQYDRMPGQVSLKELIEKKDDPKFRVFISFLELAKISLDEVQQLDKFESLTAKLEGVQVSFCNLPFALIHLLLDAFFGLLPHRRFLPEGGLGVKPREATKILYSGFSLGLDAQPDRLTIRR